MSESDSLPSFKVSDLQGPPRVKDAKPGFKPPASGDEVQQSMGFLRIEALLDEGDPSEISSNFNTLLDTLETQAADAPTPAQKHALGKAQGAVEKTADLLNYLLELQDDLKATG